jgi:MFS superfamily sulfate permease-like transporter
MEGKTVRLLNKLTAVLSCFLLFFVLVAVPWLKSAGVGKEVFNARFQEFLVVIALAAILMWVFTLPPETTKQRGSEVESEKKDPERKEWKGVNQ